MSHNFILSIYRYCTDSEAVSEMKSTFVQQYSIQKVIVVYNVENSLHSLILIE